MFDKRGKWLGLAVVAALPLLATSAFASICSEEVARLEKKLREAKTRPADQPTGKQTVDAQLGYPVTPKTMAEAERKADAAVESILSRAKAFDAENKVTECQTAVAEAKLHFGPRGQ